MNYTELLNKCPDATFAMNDDCPGIGKAHFTHNGVKYTGLFAVERIFAVTVVDTLDRLLRDANPAPAGFEKLPEEEES